MSKFFINFTKSLYLEKDQRNVTLEDIFKTFIFHKGIDKIRETYEINNKFSFQQVTEEHVRQVISWIDSSKATPLGGFPADMLQFTLETNLSLTTKVINLSFENRCFPGDLKLSEVSPNFKKNDDLEKEKYSPVNVLFKESKLFERIM